MCKCRWKFNVNQVGYKFSFSVFGLACDTHDNTILGEFYSNAIYVMDIEGKLLTKLSVIDDISGPMSLSVDKQGHLWIGQDANVKIVKYMK